MENSNLTIYRLIELVYKFHNNTTIYKFTERGLVLYLTSSKDYTSEAKEAGENLLELLDSMDLKYNKYALSPDKAIWKGLITAFLELILKNYWYDTLPMELIEKLRILTKSIGWSSEGKIHKSYLCKRSTKGF